MAVISTTKFTERMSRRLKAAGVALWVAQSSGDRWGKYLLFRIGGRCVAGCGWNQSEAEHIVAQHIANQEVLDDPELQRQTITEAL